MAGHKMGELRRWLVAQSGTQLRLPREAVEPLAALIRQAGLRAATTPEEAGLAAALDAYLASVPADVDDEVQNRAWLLLAALDAKRGAAWLLAERDGNLLRFLGDVGRGETGDGRGGLSEVQMRLLLATMICLQGITLERETAREKSRASQASAVKRVAPVLRAFGLLDCSDATAESTVSESKKRLSVAIVDSLAEMGISVSQDEKQDSALGAFAPDIFEAYSRSAKSLADDTLVQTPSWPDPKR